jgi:hypothetical protein
MAPVTRSRAASVASVAESISAVSMPGGLPEGNSPDAPATVKQAPRFTQTTGASSQQLAVTSATSEENPQAQFFRERAHRYRAERDTLKQVATATEENLAHALKSNETLQARLSQIEEQLVTIGISQPWPGSD